MTWQAEIVVRAKNGIYYAGFASQYPLSEGYRTVKSFGSWYGSQMSYQPFRAAWNAARAYAIKLADANNRIETEYKKIDDQAREEYKKTISAAKDE